jgi:hypothetical protein
MSMANRGGGDDMAPLGDRALPRAEEDLDGGDDRGVRLRLGVLTAVDFTSSSRSSRARDGVRRSSVRTTPSSVTCAPQVVVLLLNHRHWRQKVSSVATRLDGAVPPTPAPAPAPALAAPWLLLTSRPAGMRMTCCTPPARYWITPGMLVSVVTVSVL